MAFSSRLLHGAAVCREIDDVITAMTQADPLRGIPMGSDDHRYMCLQPSPFPLAHPLATQVVRDYILCLFYSRSHDSIPDIIISF